MRSTITQARSLVVKIGTQTLTDASKRIDATYLRSVANQVAVLRQRGVTVTLVSSGAIAAGMGELDLPKRPTDLPKLQAVAAVGQRRLMDAWAEAFAPHGLHVAQILLTREDIDGRKRFLNLRNTVHALHEMGAVPVINENDTISTDELVEISFGDNDILAAHVAAALRTDVLVLLSNVDGVLDGDGRGIRTIKDPAAAESLIRTDKSGLGKGGMNSKFAAAAMVTRGGETLVVARGRDENVLVRLADGEELGTVFLPRKTSRASGRSRWIGAARPAGTVVVDDGAARAIVSKNVSLLPAGVTAIRGDFEKGDVVSIETAAGDKLAHGLTNYSAADLARIRGQKSAAIRAMLAERAYDEVVHRDNLVKLSS
ncbi:MAG TPA: glutamate 5-kinase [Tepidisphaeraceae bacterium]|jgi:glutamate 5-kinase